VTKNSLHYLAGTLTVDEKRALSIDRRCRPCYAS
jgi:hypothetical protein